jgi:hypothetical protein
MRLAALGVSSPRVISWRMYCGHVVKVFPPLEFKLKNPSQQLDLLSQMQIFLQQVLDPFLH